VQTPTARPRRGRRDRTTSLLGPCSRSERAWSPPDRSANSVAEVARELGVCWWTVMDAVVLHGTPLIDDPARVGPVRAMGIDETNYQAATREHPTIYATGLVDLAVTA